MPRFGLTHYMMLGYSLRKESTVDNAAYSYRQEGVPEIVFEEYPVDHRSEGTHVDDCGEDGKAIQSEEERESK